MKLTQSDARQLITNSMSIIKHDLLETLPQSKAGRHVVMSTFISMNDLITMTEYDMRCLLRSRINEVRTELARWAESHIITEIEVEWITAPSNLGWDEGRIAVSFKHYSKKYDNGN